MDKANAPTLSGYVVRPISVEDAESWARYVCLPEVAQFFSTAEQNADELKPEIFDSLSGRPDAPIRFVAHLPDQHEVIATVGFHSISTRNNTSEITYDVSPTYWGRGIASSLCRAATTWAFETHSWNRIQATTMTNNIRSQRVLERCGFQKEGLLRNYRSVKNVPTDFLLYSLIR